MNTKKKIEQYLHTAPKPAAPDGLLNRLKEDVASTEVKTHGSAIRRWFAPSGRSISFWRVAAAATIAIIILLPLSYGATKVIKYFTISSEFKFEYPEDDVVYTISKRTIIGGDNINSKEDARKVLEEIDKLYREGKAKEVKPGVWQVTLSNGEKFAFAGGPESIGLSEAEKKEKKQLLKKQFDEIEELRKAGKFEKTYKPENDFVIDGVKYRYFEARYTLSNGKVVKIGSSEPAKDEDKQ